MSTTEQSPQKVKTNEVRASFVKVFKPEKYDENDENDKGKYSLQIIIPKSDAAGVKLLMDAQEAARQAGKKLWGGKIPAKLKMAIRDGDDVEEEEYAEREDAYFINCTSSKKPDVIGKARDAAGKALRLTEEDFYSGCFCKVAGNFFPFAGKQNGIAFGVNNILKTRDGDKLAGGAPAESDFADELEQEDDGDFLD